MTHLGADRQGLMQMVWALQGPGLQLIHSREGVLLKKKKKRNKNMSENLTRRKAGSKMAPVQSRSCWLTSSAMIKGRMGGVGVGGRGFVGWCNSISWDLLIMFFCCSVCHGCHCWFAQTHSVMSGACIITSGGTFNELYGFIYAVKISICLM